MTGFADKYAVSHAVVRKMTGFADKYALQFPIYRCATD